MQYSKAKDERQGQQIDLLSKKAGIEGVKKGNSNTERAGYSAYWCYWSAVCSTMLLVL